MFSLYINIIIGGLDSSNLPLPSIVLYSRPMITQNFALPNRGTTYKCDQANDALDFAPIIIINHSRQENYYGNSHPVVLVRITTVPYSIVSILTLLSFNPHLLLPLAR